MLFPASIICINRRLFTMSNPTPRNSIYDFLKFVGLSSIVLAHVNPPSIMMMVRSFDVPLMVFLSALLARLSYEKKSATDRLPVKYVISRTKRLVFPTWIFLTVYFVIFFIITRKAKDISYYIASYGLTRYGFGYVWIILIYLYVSILVPVFHKCPFSIKSIAIVGIIYFIYELGYHFQIGIQNKIIETSFYYIIPYGTVAFIGYHYPAIKTKNRNAVLVLSCICFIALFVYYWTANGIPQFVRIAKYPPRIYYLSYGMMCSFALLMLCEKFPKKWFGCSFFKYISSHSMWIYLWHILWLDVYEKLGLPSIWYVRYLIVYIGAIITVQTVNKCLDIIEKHIHFSPFRYLRG